MHLVFTLVSCYAYIQLPYGGIHSLYLCIVPSTDTVVAGNLCGFPGYTPVYPNPLEPIGVKGYMGNP